MLTNEVREFIEETINKGIKELDDRVNEIRSELHDSIEKDYKKLSKREAKIESFIHKSDKRQKVHNEEHFKHARVVEGFLDNMNKILDKKL